MRAQLSLNSLAVALTALKEQSRINCMTEFIGALPEAETLIIQLDVIWSLCRGLPQACNNQSRAVLLQFLLGSVKCTVLPRY